MNKAIMIDGTLFRYTNIRNYYISEYGQVISITKHKKKSTDYRKLDNHNNRNIKIDIII